MLESRSLLLIHSITVLTIHQFRSSAFSVATQLSFSLQDATGKPEFEICMPVTCKHTTMCWKAAACLWFPVLYVARSQLLKAELMFFSICIKITLAFLFICTCKPPLQPLLSLEVCAVKVCRRKGNQATVLAALLAVTQMLLLPLHTTNHSV